MDIMFLLVAFGFGLIAKFCRLPPLIGFLLAGFVLNAVGYSNNDTLQAIADLGITIMRIFYRTHFSSILNTFHF